MFKNLRLFFSGLFRSKKVRVTPTNEVSQDLATSKNKSSKIQVLPPKLPTVLPPKLRKTSEKDQETPSNQATLQQKKGEDFLHTILEAILSDKLEELIRNYPKDLILETLRKKDENGSPNSFLILYNCGKSKKSVDLILSNYGDIVKEAILEKGSHFCHRFIFDITQKETLSNQNVEKIFRFFLEANYEEFEKEINDNIANIKRPFSYLNLFALQKKFDNAMKEYCGGKKNFEEFKKLSAAKIIASLAYSKSNSSSLDTPTVISDFLEKNSDYKDKEFFIKKINMIRNQALFGQNGKKYKAIESSFTKHSAYFIVECDGDVPKKISHCDGSCPFSFSEESNSPHKFGETVFEVADNIKSLEDLERKIAEETSKHEFLTHPKILKNLVKLDEKGMPKIIEQHIPTKPQNRGNCSFKSLNIAVRTLMRIENGKVFGNEERKKFKEFKHNLIDSCIKTIAECAKSENFQKEALVFLKETIIPKAQDKISKLERQIDQPRCIEEIVRNKKILEIAQQPIRSLQSSGDLKRRIVVMPLNNENGKTFSATK